MSLLAWEQKRPFSVCFFRLRCVFGDPNLAIVVLEPLLRTGTFSRGGREPKKLQTYV